MTLGLLMAGPAFAVEPTPRAPVGWLDVEDPGCSESKEESATTQWDGETRVVHSLTIWLSLQETIRSGPVEVEVDPAEKRIAAWIPTETVKYDDTSQIPTCIRPLTLHLRVEPLVRMDYAWHLRRDPRAVDEPVYRRALEAARAKAEADTKAAVTSASEASPAEAGEH
jgi:hypothetical protein